MLNQQLQKNDDIDDDGFLVLCIALLHDQLILNSAVTIFDDDDNDNDCLTDALQSV